MHWIIILIINFAFKRNILGPDKGVVLILMMAACWFFSRILLQSLLLGGCTLQSRSSPWRCGLVRPILDTLLGFCRRSTFPWWRCCRPWSLRRSLAGFSCRCATSFGVLVREKHLWPSASRTSPRSSERIPLCVGGFVFLGTALEGLWMKLFPATCRSGIGMHRRLGHSGLGQWGVGWPG